jgi:hypothetical protein
VDLDRGRFLYHYTDREAAFEHILPRREIRFSPYTRVHDPLENQPWRFSGSYVGEDQSPEKAFSVFHAHAMTIWNIAKLVALTDDAPEEPTDSEAAKRFRRGWARPRMWDRYAEHHRGVCLVFDRERLATNLAAALQAQGFPSPYHRRVDYSDDASPFNVDLNSLPSDVTPRYVADFIEDHHDSLFFLKKTDWATECEYRFVVTTPGDDYLLVDYGDALTAVIAGEQFPPWQRAGAIELCQVAGADARRVDWSQGWPYLGPLRVRPAPPR